MTIDIVEQVESPTEAWRQLTAYSQVEGVCEQRRLQREMGSLKMEPGDGPKKPTLKVDRAVAEMKPTRLDVVKDNQVNVAIVSGLSHEYGMNRRILDCEATLKIQKI